LWWSEKKRYAARRDKGFGGGGKAKIVEIFEITGSKKKKTGRKMIKARKRMRSPGNEG